MIPFSSPFHTTLPGLRFLYPFIALNHSSVIILPIFLDLLRSNLFLSCFKILELASYQLIVKGIRHQCWMYHMSTVWKIISNIGIIENLKSDTVFVIHIGIVLFLKLCFLYTSIPPHGSLRPLDLGPAYLPFCCLIHHSFYHIHLRIFRDFFVLCNLVPFFMRTFWKNMVGRPCANLQ